MHIGYGRISVDHYVLIQDICFVYIYKGRSTRGKHETERVV